MIKLIENKGTVMTCLCEILVGILLFINPVGFTSGIIIMFGIVLLISGIFGIVGYFCEDAAEAVKGQKLSRGLIRSAAGLFCIVQSHWFIAAFPILTFLYGVIVLVLGFFKVQFTVDLIRLKKKKWGVAVVGTCLNLLLAAIILLNPFGSTIVLWTFIAATLIIEAVLDIAAIFVSGK